MSTFFFINNQNEEGIQGINGLYSSLNSIYQKILEQQFDQTKEFKEYKLSCISREGDVTSLITVELFLRIMRSFEGEPDIDAMRELFIECANEALIVAFLESIILPEGTDLKFEQRQSYIRLLNACEMVLNDEESSVYLDIVRAGIKMYSVVDF